MNPFEHPNVKALIDGYPLSNLDAGKPRTEVLGKLKGLTPQLLFESLKIKDESAARCCLAGLWLWHNFLHESHEISQAIETDAGSAWHGLMHRREGDFWNANYWFAKVRDRAPFAGVDDECRRLGSVDSLLSIPELDHLWQARPWSPASFTNEVERILIEKNPSHIAVALRLATAEWRALFRACWLVASE